MEVGGEVVGYTLFALDVRTAAQRWANARANTLDGNLNVFIPGHGQRAAGVPKVVRAIAECSRSKVVWSVDIDPPRGGDPVKA